MPKVLRIINRFNLGGPTYNVSYLTKYMNNGFETMLLGGVPDEGEVDSLFILEDIGVKPFIIKDLKRTPNFKDDLKAYSEIKRIIEEYKPDIVHTHASKAGAIGRLAALNQKVPVIVHTYHGHVFDGYFGRFKTFLYKSIERYLASKSTGIVAISPEQKRDLSLRHKICREDKIKVIPLGFDLNRFHHDRTNHRIGTRAKYQIKEDEVAIAIIGRLVKIKNHTFFLDSIEEVARRTTKKLRVFIVGDGTEIEYLKEKVARIDAANLTIEFTSWVKDIHVFNPGMDIICLTSFNEGTPVSLIEAQASSVAVLSTDVGGVQHVVKQGKTGIIVQPNDLESYVESLADLIENEEKRSFLSQNGWDYVKEAFHYEKLVQNMEQYYEELLCSQNAKTGK